MKEKHRTVQDEARIQLMNDAYNNNNQRQMFQNQEDLKKRGTPLRATEN